MPYGQIGPVVAEINITTDASGDFTTTTSRKFTGRLVQYRYVPAASDALDANWDLDVVGADTGVVLINEDNLAATAVQKAIGQILYNNAGAAFIYETDVNVGVPGIWLNNEALTVTVDEGGNAQSGTLYLWFVP